MTSRDMHNLGVRRCGVPPLERFGKRFTLILGCHMPKGKLAPKWMGSKMQSNLKFFN